jgi:hypothetical protein
LGAEEKIEAKAEHFCESAMEAEEKEPTHRSEGDEQQSSPKVCGSGWLKAGRDEFNGGKYYESGADEKK